jgi:hypothetical protein
MPGSGPDGWTNVAPVPRTASKAGDLTHFGRVRDRPASSSGLPLGPSGERVPDFVLGGFATDTCFVLSPGFFARKGAKEEKAADSGRGNSFALLGDAEAAADAAPAPERKKLQLAPRTVPKEGEDGKIEETPEATPVVSDEQIERSITNGVAECAFLFRIPVSLSLG